jgi:RNA polymerase sigma-70 factor (ECF subfamily)
MVKAAFDRRMQGSAFRRPGERRRYAVEDKLKALISRQGDRVYRMAFSICPNEADDIWQEVFLKWLWAKPDFPDEARERAWLLKVTAKECEMVLRSFRWKRTSSLEEANHTEPPQADHVLPSVMMLEPKYRTVVYLQ